MAADVLHGGAPPTVEETQDLSDFLRDLTLALSYLPEKSPRLGLAQDDAAGQSGGPHGAARFGEHVGLTLTTSAPAVRVDEAIHDGKYALALASHEPGFLPGAPVLPFDAGGPAHMGV